MKITTVLLLALMALAVALITSACAAELQQTTQKPNIIFILTDDQDVRSIHRMRFLQENLVDKGVLFTDSFTTTPVCCPSRASILRGQYPHNHGVLVAGSGGQTGYDQWKASGHNRNNLATWLNNAGYTTAYMGKFMNGYDKSEAIPNGWDKWWGYTSAYYDLREPGWRVNANGDIRTIPYPEYRVDADYLAEKSTAFIRSSSPGGRPFFLMVAPTVPHAPFEHAARHANLFSDARYPKAPNFNEADVSDKPPRIQAMPLLDSEAKAEINKTYRDRLRGLQAVDEMLARIVRAVNVTGHGGETYIIYGSDNGFLQGEHRVFNTKGPPYEKSIRIPLVIRGPGIPQGITRDQMVAEIDWAPTIAKWARVPTPNYVDGRSLTPLLQHNPEPWRNRMLLEFFNHYKYSGVRTESDEVYVEWEGADAPAREYYDLKTDPYQLENAAGEYPLRESQLSTLTATFKNCSGTSCRNADGGP